MMSMSLHDIVVEKIRSDGPISFHDFMEMALYHPGYGYYTCGRERIGKHGDYYTSPCVTPLLGQMLAKQIEKMRHLLNEKKFTIVEFGAGNGLLCSDILNELEHNKNLQDGFRYCIIEKNSLPRQTFLTNHNATKHQSIQEIQEFTGCILSNELVDNFPVHQVVMEDELMEVFVDHKNDFIEQLLPASEPLKNYLEELQVILPKGFRTEINLEAIEWIREMTAAIKKGFIITIDYGFPSAELYSSKRSMGTLACYHAHQANFCPYIHIGEQDITTHVNFSALKHWGKKNGLNLCGFTSQSNFLFSLGLCDYLRKTEGSIENKDDRQKIWLLRTFLMDMGQKLKVLIQCKGIESSPLLGLQFSERLD